MVEFEAIIEKFGNSGSSSGWRYIIVPLDIIEKLGTKSKKAFRVKGQLDNYELKLKTLMPVGEGNFMMPLSAEIRRKIKKESGAKVKLILELDIDSVPLSRDLLLCLEDDLEAKQYFNSLNKSNQKYFSDWIESAKTISTKEKRLVTTLNALSLKWSFGEMIRNNKSE